MTDVALLQDILQKLSELGVTPTRLAAEMGWSMPTYYSRISGESEWKATEIVRFTRLSGISRETRDVIFLQENASENHE
jgi:hypothetical protein